MKARFLERETTREIDILRGMSTAQQALSYTSLEYIVFIVTMFQLVVSQREIGVCVCVFCVCVCVCVCVRERERERERVL